MSGPSRSTVVTINNPQGLHMRPAYLFAETASQFESQIELVKDDLRVDGKSVISILTLGATQGMRIKVEVMGDDAELAMDALVDLLSSGFPPPGDQPE